MPVASILRGPFKPTLDKRDAWLRTCIAGLPPLRGGRWKHESVRAATHLPRRAGSNWAPHDIADRGAPSGASLFFVVASFVSFALTASGRAHSLRCSSSPRRTAPPGSPRLFYSSKLRIHSLPRRLESSICSGRIRKPPISYGIGGSVCRKNSQSTQLSGEQDHDLYLKQLRRFKYTIRRAARALAPTKRGGSVATPRAIARVLSIESPAKRVSIETCRLCRHAKPPIPDGIGGLSRFFVYQKIRRAATSRIP